MSDLKPTTTTPFVFRRGAEGNPRIAAARRGETQYRDGRPCVHGHIGARYTRNASCVICQNQRNARSRGLIRALLVGAGVQEGEQA